jgi:DNA polymerase
VSQAAIFDQLETAARSVLGHPVAIGKARGDVLTLDDGTAGVVTIHPSLLLRIKDAAGKKREYAKFVADLKLAVSYLGKRKAVRKAA